MTSLASLLGAVSAALQAHPLCERVLEIETREFADDQFHFKIRVELTGHTYLQARIYYNRGHVDYAYQLFTNAPLLRWDNKEEFSFIETFPHHHHDQSGNILASPLIGDPVVDIQRVLAAVAEFLSTISEQAP